MRRRELIHFIAGAALAGPHLARAQAQRRRRVGVVMLYPENDRQGQLRATAFRDQLEKLGWSAGRNLQIDFHWGTGDAAWLRATMAEAVRLQPDILLANGDSVLRAAQQETGTVPVIFIGSSDPVADGLVQSLAHPGGNVTGFGVMEPSLGVKLLGLLKQVAPNVRRVGALLNPDSGTHKRVLALLVAGAPGFAVEVVSASGREVADAEAAMSRWGQEDGFGVIVPPDPITHAHRDLVIALAARYRLPTVYALRAAAAEGGLMSYGVDIVELFRQAAIYTDRVLKGEKPGDLPVQLPTKFELVVNLKTAKALGLDVPASLLSTADEVIE